jgi:hypothetical protein
VTRLLDDTQLFFRFFAVSLRAQMQYRASFWMLTFAQMMTFFLEFLGVCGVCSIGSGTCGDGRSRRRPCSTEL